jgi:hypothetical protein
MACQWCGVVCGIEMNGRRLQEQSQQNQQDYDDDFKKAGFHDGRSGCGL